MSDSGMGQRLRRLVARSCFEVVRLRDASAPSTYGYYLDRVRSASLPERLSYLVEHADARRNFEAILPKTRSVVVVAKRIPVHSHCDPSVRIARFAGINDYHLSFKRALNAFAEALALLQPNSAEASRACTDSAPILERELARSVHIGIVGHNQQLIIPGEGSHYLLAELFCQTDWTHYRQDFAKGGVPAPLPALGCARCGSCARQCPTGALTGGYDVGKCIAYWNTQHVGVLPPAIAVAMGNRLWGCDTCQDACPHNRGEHAAAALSQCGDFCERSALCDLTLTEILTLSQRQLRKRLQLTCLNHAHPALLIRNACIVIANTRQTRYIAPIASLASHARQPWLRETASWALSRLHPVLS